MIPYILQQSHVLIVLLTVVAPALLAQAATPAFQPERLQVENRTNPLGIDVVSPRLSWNLNRGAGFQSAYQVRAASTADLLDQDRADLWDSGKVASPQSSGIVYRGAALQSRRRIFWQVRVWSDSQSESPSQWSAPAVFEIGLLNPPDWAGQWIAHPSWSYGQPLPIFVRQFTTQKPVRSARLYVTGLGVYVVTLNGRRVTDDVLAPGNTMFAKHVEYAAYDITSLLADGANAIGVQLGNGSYNAILTPGHYMDFVNKASAPLKLIAQLELAFTDGASQTIASGRDWRTTLGPTMVSTWYGGEEYDARREPAGWDRPGTDLSGWDFAVATMPPAETTQLSWRPAPPVRAVGSVATQAITEPLPGIYVFDMGVNFAGWQQLKVSGPAGTRVTMMIAEQLYPDGTVDQSQITRDYPVIDTYVLSGNGVEIWHPNFEYHGFRYLQAGGLPGAARQRYDHRHHPARRQ